MGFALKVGEIGIADYDPTTSPYGYHIIKVVELIAALYFFQQGEIRWAVEAGLVGLVVPILSLAILKFTTTHSA